MGIFLTYLNIHEAICADEETLILLSPLEFDNHRFACQVL